MKKYILHWIDSVQIEKTFSTKSEMIEYIIHWLGDDIEEVEE